MSLAGKRGVDISAANGNIDLAKVKAAGFDFVMIRCGYGNDEKSQDDSCFEANVKKAEALGMPWGAYLYSYALNLDDAKSEAAHAIRLLKGKKPTLPLAFDMEDADGYKKSHGMPSNEMLVDICKTFLSTTSKAGYYSSLYASLSWLDNQLNDKSLLDNYDVWVAQWSSKCQYDGRYGMWQYGGAINYLDDCSIDGVGVIDQNIAYKDYPEVIKAGEWNNWTKSATLQVLDKTGYKKGDNTIGCLSMKELLKIARSKKIISKQVDENCIFGDGTQIAVNQVLAKLGYQQNGIAGRNFIMKLTDLIIKAG